MIKMPKQTFREITWYAKPERTVPYEPHIVVKFDKGRLVPGTPPAIHHNRQEAEAEAVRLAQQFPGTEYCIFRHISSAFTESTPPRVLTYV